MDAAKQRLAALGLGMAIGSAATIAATSATEEPAAKVETVRMPGTAPVLSRKVAPGATIIEGVGFQLGARPTGAFDLMGDAADRFEIVSIDYADLESATLISVTARNTSDVAAHLRGFIHYTQVP